MDDARPCLVQAAPGWVSPVKTRNEPSTWLFLEVVLLAQVSEKLQVFFYNRYFKRGSTPLNPHSGA